MNKLTKTTLLLSTIKLLLASNYVLADSTEAEEIKKSQWGVGIQLDHASIYRDQKNKYFANIFFQYRGEKFNLDSNSISYSVFDTERFNIEILAKTLHFGYEQDDAPILNGMDERKASLELGARGSYKTDYGLLSLHFLNDVLGKHKGQEVELRFGEPFYTDQWTGNRDVSIGVHGGLRWQSARLIDYYYGVKASEATATRAAYSASSALIPFLGVELKTRLSKHFFVNTGLSYEHLPNSITASPLTTDSENELRANLGISYWF